MKERIKKFCKANEDACIYVAGLVMVTTASIIIARKGIDDMRVVAVGDKQKNGVHTIAIRHKNGTEEFWHVNREM